MPSLEGQGRTSFDYEFDLILNADLGFNIKSWLLPLCKSNVIDPRLQIYVQ